jgi:hypothetical protein
MIIRKDTAARVATIIVEDNDILDAASLDGAIKNIVIDPADMTAIDLVIPSNAMGNATAVLQSRDFTIAGMLSANAQTSMRLRKNLTSGDSKSDPNLAITATHPGSAADAAILPGVHEWLEARYSPESVARRVREIEAEVERRRPAGIDAEYTQRLAAAALKTKHRRDSGD